MIKYYIKILIIILSLTSCKEEEGVNTRKLISNYNLKNSDNYIKNALTFSVYENTNHFLYLVQNKNKDTIFKYFDSTKIELRVRDFFKYEGDYFSTLWKPSIKKYVGKLAIPNSKNDVFESLYRYDSLNIYKIDTLSYLLTEIKKPTLKNISEIAKNTLNLKGNYGVIKSNSKLRLIKDTLVNHKVLYEYDVGLEIKKGNQDYNLEPYFFNKSKVELDEKNISLYKDRFLTSEKLKGDIKYYCRYDEEYNYIGFSKMDFIFNQSNKEYTISTYADSLFILDDNYKKTNIDSLSPLQIEPFKYINGEFFFFLTQESLEYWDGVFPMIYYIDMEKLKIGRVLPLANKENKKVNRLIKHQEVNNLSTFHKSTLSYLLKDFEIVKVGNEYKTRKVN